MHSFFFNSVSQHVRKRSEIPQLGDDNNWTIQNDNLEKDKPKRGPSVWIWKEEGKNVALLFFLYLLQGIPLGLIASIPLMLQNAHVSYKVNKHKTN